MHPLVSHFPENCVVSYGAMRRRGLALPETLMGIFLLVTAMIMTATLYHSALNATVRSEAQALAVNVAEKHLARLRTWSRTRTATGYNFDDWASVNGASAPDADYPEFTVQTDVEPYLMASPCTRLDSPFAEARRMDNSAMKVRVRVSWDNRRYDLISVIADPPREWHPTSPLRLTQVGTPSDPLTQGGVSRLNVVGFDSDDQPVRDLFYSWFVVPHDGNGRISYQSRDGKTGEFQHEVQIEMAPPPVPPVLVYSPPGTTADLAVRARLVAAPAATSQQMRLGP